MTKPLTVRNRFENTDVEFNNKKQLNFVSGFKANYHFLRAFGLWPFYCFGQFFEFKMSSFGLSLNFEWEYRRALLLCTTQTITTICVETIYHVTIIIPRPVTLYTVLNHFVFKIFVYIALAAISTSFVTFLLNLKTRYATLNSNLKWVLFCKIF